MRTTLNINQDLFDSAKAVARRQKCPVGTIVDEALRGFLSPPPQRTSGARRYDLPRGGRGGLLPGVDVDSNADLLAAMENGNAAHGR